MRDGSASVTSVSCALERLLRCLALNACHRKCREERKQLEKRNGEERQSGSLHMSHK